LFGAQGEALEMAVQYGRILLLVFPLHNTGFTFNTALRASGDSLTPMYLMLSTLLINLAFNVLFILGIGPFPKLGILGVAYSTALAQIYLLLQVSGFIPVEKRRFNFHYINCLFLTFRP
jgi:Na+-driven multidrug efflux pump